jgi:hypothetical protein
MLIFWPNSRTVIFCQRYICYFVVYTFVNKHG